MGWSTRCTKSRAHFFELPFEVKAGYRYVEDQYVGWCGGEFLGQYGSADHKEMYHIGPRVAPTLGAHGSGRRRSPASGRLNARPPWPAARCGPRRRPSSSPSGTTITGPCRRPRSCSAVSWPICLGITETGVVRRPRRQLGRPGRQLLPSRRPVPTAAPRYTTHPTATSPSSPILHQDQSRVGGLSVQSARRVLARGSPPARHLRRQRRRTAHLPERRPLAGRSPPGDSGRRRRPRRQRPGSRCLFSTAPATTGSSLPSSTSTPPQSPSATGS